jgi:hypothetical protein
MSSIYATTISSEKYIIINSQNIELSGNVIMKEHVTISNGLLNTNSVIPNVTNNASLGSTSNRWSNAYIRDLSVNNNLQVTGNVKISENLDVSNIYTKNYIDNSFVNVYTRTHIDLSFANVYNRSHIDQSFQNVYTRGYIDQSFTNVYTRGHIDQSYANVYARGVIDTSFQNVYTRIQFDNSYANVYTIEQFDNSYANVYTRGRIDQSFANVYTRGYLDQSFANVYTITQFDNSYANVYTRIQVDNSFAYKHLFDASYNALAIGGGGGSTSSIDVSLVSSNIIPLTTNNVSLGSTSKYWNNAYINNLRLSNRAYQEISGDISWNAVNGYYGLAKDAYPSLNPRSNGILAVTNLSTRRRFTWGFASCCWSPQLLRFVGAGSQRATWSNDGINWIQNLIANQDSRLHNGWNSICWSPELILFVAVGDNGRVMRSSDGISWTFTVEFSTARWLSVCWSPELTLFVATGATGTGNRVITSPDGITWSRQINIPDSNWLNVCWSAELGIFLAASSAYADNIFMISRNGINWTGLGVPPNAVGLRGICWSKELGLFVGVIGQTSIISNNGLTWTSYYMNWSAVAWSICWIPELKLFVVINDAAGFLLINTSRDGINWDPVTYSGDFKAYRNITWSPELGIFVCISSGSGSGSIHTALVSSLKGRPPTSYNVFDSSFNRIDETGKWDFSNIDVTTLNVTGTFTNTSDDRLKHNEVIITNGLDVIDRLNPKFYQKTQNMLDASYNGDLSGQAWTYEAGLIAQELLQIPDLSFAVSGGDYYQESYILKNQTNDISTNYYDISSNYYDISSNYYDISANNYDISYNLITQPYSLNYNSIIVYGLAAIKELHAKVKAQDISLLTQQTIINSLTIKMQALENYNQV